MLHRAAGLRAAGYSDDDIRRLLRSGVLTPVRRGAYVEGSPDDRDAGHALERAHVTFDRRTGGRLDARLHVHTAPVHPDDIVMVDGLAVTSWARTVVDIARRARFEPAVAVADAALLTAGRTQPAPRLLGDPRGVPLAVGSRATDATTAGSPELRVALDAAVRRAKGWPGVPAARRVVAFADGRAESVGESRSRIAKSCAGGGPTFATSDRLPHASAADSARDPAAHP